MLFLPNSLVMDDDTVGNFLGETKINFDTFPVTDTLRNIFGGVQGVVILVLGIVLVVATVMWAIGRGTGAQKMQQVGAGGAIISLAAVAVVAGAPALVAWASRLEIINNPKVAKDAAPIEFVLPEVPKSGLNI